VHEGRQHLAPTVCGFELGGPSCRLRTGRIRSANGDEDACSVDPGASEHALVGRVPHQDGDPLALAGSEVRRMRIELDCQDAVALSAERFREEEPLEAKPANDNVATPEPCA
jgi:hypothetical protein